MTYHWNNGRGTPAGGTIALRSADGKMFGPWGVSTTPGQGGVPNANWIANPNVVIPAGSYTVIDSDPATWAQNGQSGGRGMLEIKGVEAETSPHSVKKESPQGQKGASKQIIESIRNFRLEAIEDPIAALKKYSSVSNLKEFTDIESALFTETPPGVGWKYYIATATYTVVHLMEQTHVVLFYHPWSDTAIITLWEYDKNRFVITRAELILGDYIRQYGKTPFEAQPLWERNSVTITPLLAIQIAVGETLVAFENIFSNSGKVDRNSPFIKQVRSFDKNTQNKEVARAMIVAANLRFERAITALVRYEDDKKFEVYRDAASYLLSSIKMGDFTQLIATIPQTSQETFDFIKANNKKIGMFKVVSVLKTPNDCFIFLSHPIDPNNVLVLWLQTSQGKYGLRQAHFINHSFSASYIGQMKELVKIGRQL